MDVGLQPEYEIINGRQVVKKHVATIHCSNKLSLLERKISNALLFHAFPHLKSQLIHEIKIDELKRLIGSNTRNHKALKEALRKLICTVLEWNLLGENIPELELEGWNASTILSAVSVQKGIIRYQYSELIKTLIIDPKIYGKINLTIQARFNSSYSLALYENCSRYRGLPYTKNIEIGVFRKLMGVEDGKYDIFRDFNRRVLNPAISEINTCSDIRVSPEITRMGRTVKSIKFKIEERPIKQRMGKMDSPDESKKGRKKVKEISDVNEVKESDVFQELKTVHGTEKVDAALQYVMSRPSYKTGKIKNMVGYVASAIENDYHDMQTDNKNKQIEENKAIEKNAQKKQKAQSWLMRKTEYYRFITPEVMNHFSAWDEVTRKTLVLDFMQCIENAGSNKLAYCQNHFGIVLHYKNMGSNVAYVLAKITLHDMSSILFFEDGFSEYVIEKNPMLKEQVTSFALFVQSDSL